MAEDFKVIETQEDFDNAIKARLERERNKYAEQLTELDNVKGELATAKTQITELTEGLKSANEKIAGYDTQIAEKDKAIKAYESHSVKTRIAAEMGLSLSAIDFIKGENEDEIRKSAEDLKALVGTTQTAPLAVEPRLSETAKSDAALKTMLTELAI